MLNLQRLVFVLCTLLIAFVLAPTLAQAQSDVAREKFLTKANNKPLVSLRQAADRARARPVKPGPAREVPNYRGNGKPIFGGGTATSDAVLQSSVGEQLTVTGSGFHGSSNEDNAAVVGFMIAPPDTDGQVGPNHYVQMINLLTTIFDKSGNIVPGGGPFPSNAIWTGIGGNCEAYNQGDPIILYDDVEDRWLVSQFAFPDSMNTYSQCVAISVNGDPTGTWNRYEFPFDSIGLNDYPKHGIASDSITIMANLFTPRGRQFSWGGTFLGVMDKAAMYAGAPSSLIGFNIGTGEFGFVAGDLDGGGSAPALFATAMSTADRFEVWQMDVNWGTEDASVSKIASIPITAFDSELCSASRGACIPQPDGGPLLESLSDRLMHRLQIRDFNSYRTMVTAHTVDVDGVGDGRAGIRWYEMRQNKVYDVWSNWFLYQEGTYGPADGEYRFMPSAAMNAAGDIGIGYLLSSTNTWVSTAVVGQTATASGSGLLNSEELICGTGTGVQEDVSRSGDYSSTSVDPVDDSFWHTNEVFTKTGSFLWDTYICEFAVADSGSNTPPVADFSYVCNELSCTFTDESTDSDGTIASWSWAFGDSATATTSSPSHTYAADGSYEVTLWVTDNDGDTDSIAQTVVVSGPENIPPTASFTFDCTDLDCNFNGSGSDDSDGTIVGYAWTFDDGGTATTQNPSHSYAADGTYSVKLTVTDDDGATGSDTQDVTVIGAVVNEPPVATFTSTCTELSCDFNGTGSYDPDGSISSYAWTFGDGGSGSGASPTHNYASGDTYSVTLTVTDDDTATGSDTQDVTVSTVGVCELVAYPQALWASKNRWTAYVTDLGGSVLQGSWSESGNPFCTDSTCELSNIHKRISSVTFTAENQLCDEITIYIP